MWRAVFLSIGITLMVLGLECLYVDQVVIRKFQIFQQSPPPTQSTSLFQPASFAQPQKSEPTYTTFEPKEWMPWSLLAAGSVVVIYTFSLPGRTSGRTSSDSSN